MNTHRARLRQVNMLTGSRYIEITAQFVRRFVGLAVPAPKLCHHPSAHSSPQPYNWRVP